MTQQRDFFIGGCVGCDWFGAYDVKKPKSFLVKQLLKATALNRI